MITPIEHIARMVAMTKGLTNVLVKRDALASVLELAEIGKKAVERHRCNTSQNATVDDWCRAGVEVRAACQAFFDKALAEGGEAKSADQIMRESADHAFEKFTKDTKGTP